jgi:hypothetical protein
MKVEVGRAGAGAGGEKRTSASAKKEKPLASVGGKETQQNQSEAAKKINFKLDGTLNNGEIGNKIKKVISTKTDSPLNTDEAQKITKEKSTKRATEGTKQASGEPPTTRNKKRNAGIAAKTTVQKKFFKEATESKKKAKMAIIAFNRSIRKELLEDKIKQVKKEKKEQKEQKDYEYTLYFNAQIKQFELVEEVVKIVVDIVVKEEAEISFKDLRDEIANKLNDLLENKEGDVGILLNQVDTTLQKKLEGTNLS